nr:MAG TPA: keratin [Caudoviricetes sp.]
MRDLTKYDINDLRNLVTRQEAQIAAYKLQIQELEEKMQEKENEKVKTSE